MGVECFEICVDIMEDVFERVITGAAILTDDVLGCF